MYSEYPEKFYKENFSKDPKASDSKSLRLEDINTFIKGVKLNSTFYTLQVIPNVSINCVKATSFTGSRSPSRR